jgi:hypothetical protein
MVSAKNKMTNVYYARITHFCYILIYDYSVNPYTFGSFFPALAPRIRVKKHYKKTHDVWGQSKCDTGSKGAGNLQENAYKFFEIYGDWTPT